MNNIDNLIKVLRMSSSGNPDRERIEEILEETKFVDFRGEMLLREDYRALKDIYKSIDKEPEDESERIKVDNGRVYHLEMMDYGLKEVSESIGNLTELKNLYISYNKFTQLPEGIGNLTELKGLYLSDNQLTQLPENLANLRELKKLYLGGNQFTQLPGWIGNLTELKVLYLSDNKFTQLPENLANLRELKELYLTNNKLTQLPGWIRNLTELKELYLSDNPLTSENDPLIEKLRNNGVKVFKNGN